MNREQKIVKEFLTKRRVSKADSNNYVVTKAEIEELLMLLAPKLDKDNAQKLTILKVINYSLKSCTKNSPLDIILSDYNRRKEHLISLGSYFNIYDKAHESRGYATNKSQYLLALRRQIERINGRMGEEVLRLHVRKQGREIDMVETYLEILGKKSKK